MLERVATKEEFLYNLFSKMRIKTIVASDDISWEYKKTAISFLALIQVYAGSMWEDPDHPFWNLAFSRVAGSVAAVYWGKFIDPTKGTKIGNGMDCKKRVDEQPLCESAMIMTWLQIYEALGVEFVKTIARLGLPSLHYDPERWMDLARTICLYVGEGLVGCAYKNDCQIFFERLVQMPTRSVQSVVAMDRMELCHKYATTGIMPDGLQLYSQHIDFYKNVPTRGIRQLYTWETLKSHNYQSESESEFMKAQRPRMKDGFLKDAMSKRRLGENYGGYINAVPVAPAATFIKNEFMSHLLPMAQEGIFDPEIIDCALKPIRSENWDQYMDASDKELADGSMSELENFLGDDNPTATMMESNYDNLRAIQKCYPGWIEERFNFPRKLSFRKSIFVESITGGKRLSFYPAHFLIFSPPETATIETRFINTEDFLFHVDMMLANNHLGISKAMELHLLHQTHLMNLTYKEVDYKRNVGQNSEPPGPRDKSSVCFANNCANPLDYFKRSHPGIEATAQGLGIHEQTFIYLRERLGKENTYKLVSSQGMMWDGKQKEPIPYEIGARCQGTPAFGDIEEKPCGRKDPDAMTQNDYLCYVGHKTKNSNSNHPLKGYCCCKRCLYKVQQIELHHLRQQDSDDVDDERLSVLNRKLKGRATNQANYHAKSIRTKGADAVYEADRAKSLKMSAKRLGDPELRANRNKKQREYEKKRKANGGAPKPPGISRWKPDKKKTARYPPDLRAKLKQGVLIAIHHCGEKSIYTNHLINALDAIREKVTNSNEIFYYRHEYNRCITAFCEQDGKHWRPKDRFKVASSTMNKALAIRQKMKSKEFWKHLNDKCSAFDEMEVERNFADTVDFGEPAG